MPSLPLTAEHAQQPSSTLLVWDQPLARAAGVRHHFPQMWCAATVSTEALKFWWCR